MRHCEFKLGCLNQYFFWDNRYLDTACCYVFINKYLFFKKCSKNAFQRFRSFQYFSDMFHMWKILKRAETLSYQKLKCGNGVRYFQLTQEMCNSRRCCIPGRNEHKTEKRIACCCNQCCQSFEVKLSHRVLFVT